jgi:hypothetical protein
MNKGAVQTTTTHWKIGLGGLPGFPLVSKPFYTELQCQHQFAFAWLSFWQYGFELSCDLCNGIHIFNL